MARGEEMVLRNDGMKWWSYNPDNTLFYSAGAQSVFSAF